MSVLREIRIQTDPSAETRTETLNGIEYLVAPVVMLVEGVLQGANAQNPEYAPAEVIGELALQWNGRPVVMGHPKVQGTFVSANSPSVLEDWAFGFIFNTNFEDDKLKAEAWIDVQRAADLGGDFQDAVDRINNGEVVEVSTGLFCDIIEKSGKFRGQSYKGIWSNVISDHLAILPNGVIGACSVEAGCGIPRLNQADGPWGQRPGEMRLNTAALRTIQPLSDSEGGHCCETCKGAAVSTNKNKPEEEEPAVMEAVEPTPAELVMLQARGQLLVNAIPDTITFEDIRKLVQNALAKHLNKNHVYIYVATATQVVYETYSCGYGCGYGCSCGSARYGFWAQDYSVDNDGVVTFTGEPQEVVLMTKITPVVNAAGGASQEDGGAPSVNEGNDDMTVNAGQGDGTGAATTSVPVSPTPAPAAAEPAPVVNASAAAEAPKVQSLDDWMKSAPPEVVAVFQGAQKVQADRKDELIRGILANSANTMSEDQLKGFDLTTLEGISKLALNAQPASSDQHFYGGRGGLAVNAVVPSDEDRQRVNADTNKFGGARAPSVFEEGNTDTFGPRVGAFRQK